MSNIATHATQVSDLLSTLETKLAPGPEIEAIRSQLPGLSDRINLLFQGTMETLQEQPALAALQTQRQIWEAMTLHARDWLKVLTKRSVELGEALSRLTDLHGTWTKTDDAANTAKAPDALLAETGSVLAAIQEAQQRFQAQRSDVLNLQTRVAEVVSRCQDLLSQIDRAQKAAVGGILVHDGRPIWSPHLWAEARTALYPRFHAILGTCREDIQEYLSNPSAGMPLHIAIFIALVFLLWVSRSRVERWEKAGDFVTPAAGVFDHPVSAALVVTAFVATGPISPTPQTIKSLFHIAALIPMIVLAQPVIDRRTHPGLYALAILFTVDVGRRTFEGLPLIGQALLLLETAAGILTMGWFLTRGHLRRTQGAGNGLSQFQVLRLASLLVLLSLAAGFGAALFGYSRLASLMASQILGGCALALAFCAYFQVAAGLIDDRSSRLAAATSPHGSAPRRSDRASDTPHPDLVFGCQLGAAVAELYGSPPAGVLLQRSRFGSESGARLG